MTALWAAAMLMAGGLFAGAAATFAWSRVPIWRSQDLADFTRDFEQTLRRTDRVQPALLLLTIVAAGGYAFTEDGAQRTLGAAGAIAFLTVLVLSLSVMVPLQRRILASGGAEAQADELRSRWFNGNRGRSVLSVVAYGLVVAAAV